MYSWVVLYKNIQFFNLIICKKTDKRKIKIVKYKKKILGGKSKGFLRVIVKAGKF